MNNQNAQLERKNSTIQFLKQAKELIEEYPEFLEKGSSLSALYDLSKAASKNFTENNSVKNQECFEFSGGNFGNCFSFFFRSCIDDKANISYPKYTTGNIAIGFGPSIFIGMEFHRVPQLVALFFFKIGIYSIKEKKKNLNTSILD